MERQEANVFVHYITSCLFSDLYICKSDVNSVKHELNGYRKFETETYVSHYNIPYSLSHALLSSQRNGPSQRSRSLSTHRQLNQCCREAAHHPFQACAVVGRRVVAPPVEELV